MLRSIWATRSLVSAYLLNTPRQRAVTIKLPGSGTQFRFRTGTSDARLLRAALVNGFDFQEYRSGQHLNPRTILDIGANIGVVTHALVTTYPRARVFAFEPMPENVALLEHNLQQLPQVTVVPYGLGKQTRTMKYYRSDDPTSFGGGTFYPTADQRDLYHGECEVIPPQEAITRYGIRNIDLIKIDTEGAEYDILSQFPAAVLSQVSIIVGELHGVKDQELLAYLSQWFDVDHTPLHGRLSLFRAANRNLTAAPVAGAPDQA